MVARVDRLSVGISCWYHGRVSSSAGSACTSMDEHSRSELETVQKVTLISFGVRVVFMEVYLAIACWISLMASLLPRVRGDRMD
ncbi:hypothetical protein D3C80_1741700 [compost metagenome]